jgi:hypothetical protein
MTPDEYGALDVFARVEWIQASGPTTPDEERLVLGDHRFVRSAAANAHHLSEQFLQRLYDTESDEVLREVIATNPAAPLALLESVPVDRHIGASIGAYAQRAGLTHAQQIALADASAAREKRPLGEFIRSIRD